MIKTCFVLLATFSLLSSDDLTINKSKIFTTKVEPDMLVSNFTFKVYKHKYNDVDQIIHRLSNIFKKYEPMCKSSRYSINKRYTWNPEKKRNIQNGYEGNAHLVCKYKNIKDLDKLLNERYINKLIEDTNSISFHNSGSRWAVSKKLQNSKLQELEHRALIYSKEFSKELSYTLKYKCNPKNISLQRTNHITPMLSTRAKSESINNNIPTKEDFDIKYNVNYTFNCDVGK